MNIDCIIILNGRRTNPKPVNGLEFVLLGQDHMEIHLIKQLKPWIIMIGDPTVYFVIQIEGNAWVVNIVKEIRNV